jgi:hypothetical protein
LARSSRGTEDLGVTDPNRDRNIAWMSRIAFILAFITMLLGIIMYWPR